MRLISSIFALFVITSHGSAETRLLDFSMADGSKLTATLIGANPDQIVVMSESVFGENSLALRTDRFLRADGTIDPIGNLGEQSFAFLLRDQTRFVGRPIGFEQGRLRVSTIELGDVEFSVDRLVRVLRAPAIEQRLHSLAATKHLWRGDGWFFRDGELVTKDGLDSNAAFRATVGELGLQERFHLRLSLACTSEPSLQILLGDRAEDGGGQGRGRRGSSRSLSPEEERLTQLEWFGSGVSVARRTSSVADMALFDAASSSDLSLDVYVDQRRGLIAAYRDGQLVGSVELPEEEPSIHGDLTLISRGDPVAVNSLQVFRWSGSLPESRSIQAPFTETMSGELRGTATIDANTDWQTLRQMHWPRALQPYPSPCLEFLWPDGCRAAGGFTVEDGDSITFIRTLSGRKLQWEPKRVSRLIRVGGESVRAAGAELRSGRSRLRGELVASDDGALAWKATCAVRPIRLDPKANAEIQWQRTSSRSGTAMILEDGQSITGTLRGIAGGVVSFETTVSEPIQFPLSKISRLDLRSVPASIASKAKSLTLPRRQATDPPTHLVISTTGDTVRGKLAECDNNEIRIEVRSRVRHLPRSLVASVIRLRQPGLERSPKGDQTQTIVQTVDGDELAFVDLPRADGNGLVGDHVMLGSCRIPMSQLTRLATGRATSRHEEAMQLVPAKEPRTFKEE
ncbi:MAG: hypothetical protein AAFU85_04430 [Planctomycetota bacterium]